MCIRDSLGPDLPNSSAIAQLSARGWNQLRYILFKQVTPDVVPAREPVHGVPMLFYGLSVEAMMKGDEARRINQVTWALSYIRDRCKERGITLLVVLIPDKAQVYRDFLPRHVHSVDRPVPASCLWTLEKDLEDEGIDVVNLLPSFRSAAENQKVLYWGDDTHWNAEGVRIAADLTSDKVKELLHVQKE